MFWHLILTDSCNLCCSYCRARAFEPDLEEGRPVEFDPDLPAELAVDPGQLAAFLARDSDPTLTFYGGEPLLRPDLVAAVMARVRGCRFMLQTNGLLLHRLPDDVLSRFHTILVSIDGPEALTDRHRGAGVYAGVVANLEALAARGFRGEVIARMTVDEATPIEEAVLHCDALPVTGVHWQLDANFSGDHATREFGRWARAAYDPGIRRLVARWTDRMEAGEVARWYPFLDAAWDLIRGTPSRLRCGSGYANYTIQTDGTIVPCPIMTGMTGFYLGHIRDADPGALPQISVPGCGACEIASFCGGRCLYAAVTEPWPVSGKMEVCATVKNLHDALADALPRIRSLLEDGTIRPADFDHVKFNGCEIIP
jgi:putative peptide-modifying radical SAM enzyme